MGSTALGATGLLLPIDSGPFGPGPSPQPVFELCLGGVAGISISHYRLPSLIQRRPTHIVPPQGGHPVWCGITKRSPRRDTRAKSRSLIRHGGSSAPSDGTMTREKYTIVKGNHLMNMPGARRVAFVQACWHKEIVDAGRDAFVKEIADHRVPKDRIDFFEVPGSLEIPLQAKLLAKTGRYSVIVAAGLVVNGGIYRHEFVADAVINAMMQVQLETEIPILSLVLTPQSFHEHDDHKNFFREHFKIKGAEVARACAATLTNLEALPHADGPSVHLS